MSYGWIVLIRRFDNARDCCIYGDELVRRFSDSCRLVEFVNHFLSTFNSSTIVWEGFTKRGREVSWGKKIGRRTRLIESLTRSPPPSDRVQQAGGWLTSLHVVNAFLAVRQIGVDVLLTSLHCPYLPKAQHQVRRGSVMLARRGAGSQWNRRREVFDWCDRYLSWLLGLFVWLFVVSLFLASINFL